MRQLLLTGIVLILAATGIAFPFVGLCGYVWFSLMRPDILAWVEERSWYSMALAIATLLGSIRYVFDLPHRILLNRLVWPLLALQAPILASVFTAKIVDLSMQPYNQYVRMLLVLFLIPLLVKGKQELKIVWVVMAVSVALLGGKMGIYGLLVGGAYFAQGHGGMMADNNTLALAMAMSTPLCWYGRTFYRNRIWKIAAIAMFFGTIAAVVMTRSRGAALATAVGMLWIVFRSRRKVLTLAVLAVMSVPALYLTWDRFSERMSTIRDPISEVSANSRLVYSRAALRLAADYPMFGVGFGMNNQRMLITQYLPQEYGYRELVVHNTYLQMLTDSGVFALFLYVVMVFGTIWWLGKSAGRMKRLRTGLEDIPYGLQGSLIVFAVGSLFLSRTLFDYMYMIILTSAAWYRIEQQELSEAETTPARVPEPGPDLAADPAPAVAAGAPSRQSRLARELELWNKSVD
jgi:probable O-glycosylation ligase (exosortase A-associated)